MSGADEDTTWDIVVHGADYNTDFAISKIHTDGTPLKESESLETGVTYIIKAEALRAKQVSLSSPWTKAKWRKYVFF